MAKTQYRCPSPCVLRAIDSAQWVQNHVRLLCKSGMSHYPLVVAGVSVLAWAQLSAAQTCSENQFVDSNGEVLNHLSDSLSL